MFSVLHTQSGMELFKEAQNVNNLIIQAKRLDQQIAKISRLIASGEHKAAGLSVCLKEGPSGSVSGFRVDDIEVCLRTDELLEIILRSLSESKNNVMHMLHAEHRELSEFLNSGIRHYDHFDLRINDSQIENSTKHKISGLNIGIYAGLNLQDKKFTKDQLIELITSKIRPLTEFSPLMLDIRISEEGDQIQ